MKPVKSYITPQVKSVVNMLVLEQLNKEKADIYNQASKAMMGAALIVLSDKYDWGPEQLKKIMNEIFDQFDSVIEKYVRIDDFYEWLEEIGIKLR